MNTTTKLDCGHEPSEHGPIDTGYGKDRHGRSHCYDCITAMELEGIANARVGGPGATVYAYLSEDCQRITNWPGRTLMAKVRVGGRHAWSQTRHYLTAVDADGKVWTGTGGPGEYTTLRLTKRVAR